MINEQTIFDKRVLDTSQITEEEFRELRRGKIGGSDMAAVMGFNQYKSPYALYLEKAGEVDPVEENAAMEAGKVWEPHLIGEWSRRHPGQTVLRSVTIVDDEFPWLIASLDGLVVNGTIKLVVEAKTANSRMKAKWGTGDESIPESYWIQSQFYANMVARKWGIDIPGTDVIVKFENERVADCRTYLIALEPKTFGVMVQEAGKFMANLDKGIAPPVDGSGATQEYLRKRYSQDSGAIMEADPKLANDFMAFWTIRGQIDELEAKETAYKNQIISAMKENSVLMVDGKPAVTYKKVKDSVKIDWQGVCRKLKVPDEVVNEFSKVQAGSRRFLPVWRE